MISTRKTRARRNLPSAYLLLVVLIAVVSTVNAQDEKPTIKLVVTSPDTVNIQIHLKEPVRGWSFLNSYAGAVGLVQRLGEFRASAPVKMVAPGEFRADHDVAEFSYRVRLPLSQNQQPAHVSWLTVDSGLLMLADLIPTGLSPHGVDVSFDVPEGWRVYSSEAADRSGTYSVSNPSKAVFLVGAHVNSKSRSVERTRLDVALVGNWPFKEERVANGAERVLRKYFELTRFRLQAAANLVIAPATLSRGEKWQAETRGSTVVLVVDPRASFQDWIAQLEVILTHELLHLWIPNSLTLEGDYDWFFEGFTLYQALLIAQEVKLIDFKEYLNTLARVYDSYRSYVDTQSLIEASERRWTAVASPVYDKAMLVAFLYDLEVRHQTHGRSNLSDRYAELFRKFAGKTVNANDAIMSVLVLSPTTESLLKSYVESRRPVELEEPLKLLGVSMQLSGTQTRLRVASALDAEQMRILRSIGYKR